jgi:outer membrane biosynthesis protein TonB
MRIARATVAGILLASMLALGGCKKKKPAVPPPQAQAPAITQPEPEAQPPVPAASEPNRPQPEATQPEIAPAATTAPTPKPKTKPRHTAKKTVPPPAVEKPAETPAEKPPSKTVVTEGGTQPATPQLSASMPHDKVIHQKLNTNQLLEATDYNLKNIARALNADEQAMLQHIRSYMQQSRDATKDGDTERAYNLALKAHLLSDELIKH